MKYFQICVLIIGFTLSIDSVSSRNIESSAECDADAEELKRQITDCASRNFNISDAISIIQEYLDHNINNTKFSTLINEYCDTLKTSITCSVGKTVNFNPACHHHPLAQRFINLVRIIGRGETEFCSEQIFDDLANDTGFKCMVDRTVAKCAHQPPIVSNSENSWDDKHRCASLQYYQACAPQFFERCQNEGKIKKHVDQAWIILNDEFSCNAEL